MTTAPATIQIVEHGEASELPTFSWLARRLYVWFLTVVLMVFLGAIIWQLTDPRVMGPLAKVPGVIEAMRWIAMGLIGLLLSLIFTYVAGATATEWVSITAAFKSTAKTTTTTAPSPGEMSASTLTTTTASPAQGGATTTTVAAVTEPKEKLPANVASE